ncbi:uracil-DNA glycosylase [Halobellus limi]|uniref:Uracil-DNA glycosylase n=1 Tax=Halobellus limi TaxID=699433 RepID=A0A1H5WBD3_9EURY|nr:uracil-DNA glycosylase [Halobellus limi]QCC46503.1 uracil-DNA glycosylase [Halobellus limi]SEF96127.1 uracil-DNA glycosylase, family 4 [Halobellus limi]
MEPEFPTEQHALEADCARCPALVECRERISWGTGDLDADVMVVGEAPGAGNPDAERWRGGNWTGKAYTARHSGRRVRRLLAEIGRPTAYVTNAVKCFPCDGEGSNREPTETERANCRTHLREEIETVDPTVIVATGKHATTTTLALDNRTIDGFVDRILEPIELPFSTLLPVLHPSYQDIWRARLGYSAEEYREAVHDALRAALDDDPS